MLREMINHFGSTLTTRRQTDAPSTPMAKPGAKPAPALHGLRKNSGQTGAHRDWRPRLYW